MKFIFALLVLCSVAHAGVRDVGNGGAGVLINGQPLLLDLYEAGVLDPVVDPSIQALGSYQQRLSNLQILNDEEKLKLAQKLTELRIYSPKTADLVVVGIGKYLWRVLDSSLVEVSEQSPIDLSAVNYIQLANRLGSTVRINKKYWDLMSVGNKVALIIHEILYAYEKPLEVSPGIFAQDSQPVRERVGYIFSADLKARGNQGYAELTGNPRGFSTILGDSSLEVLSDYVVLFHKKTYIDAFSQSDAKLGIDGFCAKINLNMRRSKQTELTTSLNYTSSEATVKVQEYQTSNGLQKWLQVIESSFVLKVYEAGDHTFKVGELASCQSWALQQNLQLRSLQILSPTFQQPLLNR